MGRHQAPDAPGTDPAVGAPADRAGAVPDRPAYRRPTTPPDPEPPAANGAGPGGATRWAPPAANGAGPGGTPGPLVGPGVPGRRAAGGAAGDLDATVVLGPVPVGATRADRWPRGGSLADQLTATPAAYRPHPGYDGEDEPYRDPHNTGTFTRVLLTGLGGAEPDAGPVPAPPTAPPSGLRRTWANTVARTRRLAARVAAVRGDERTAMLVVGAAVGLVLLLIAVFVVVARLAAGGGEPAPAPAARVASTAAAAPRTTPAAPSRTPDPTPTGSPLPPSGGMFAARHSGLCLAAPQGRTDAGAQLVQRTCGTDFGTSFMLVAKAQADTYELVNAGSSRCADVYGASTEDAVPVVQWDCNGGPNQTFQLRPLGDGTVQIIAVHSGKCLDVTGISRDQNAPIQQFTCREPAAELDPAAGNQSWRFSAG